MALVLEVTRADGTAGNVELAPGSNFYLSAGETVSIESVSGLLSIDLQGGNVILTFAEGQIVLENMPVEQIRALAEELGTIETGALGEEGGAPDPTFILGEVLGWASPEIGNSGFSSFSSAIATGRAPDADDTGTDDDSFTPQVTTTETGTLTVTSTDPEADREGNADVPDPVSIDLFADLITAEDSDAANTPALSAGSIVVTPGAGSAFSDTRAIFVDQVLGTIGYDRAEFDALGAGEQAVFTISFDVVSGDETSPQTVRLVINGLNDAPTLEGDLAASVDEGGTVVLSAADLGYSDVDDGDSEVTFNVFGLVNGHLLVNGVEASEFTASQLGAGAVSFRHDGSEKTETASFLVYVEDGSEDGSKPAVEQFELTVTPVNDAPEVSAIKVENTDEDADPFVIDLLAGATDAEGDDLDTDDVSVRSDNGTRVVAFTIDNETGSLEIDPGQFNDLGAGESETLTITFDVIDGEGGVTPNSTTFAVEGRDDAPVAIADSATVTEDDPATAIDVLANDIDVDGGPKTITGVSDPTNGTVVITGDGSGLSYQPDAEFSGTDTFTYTLDGGSTATVTVTVTAENDAPEFEAFSQPDAIAEIGDASAQDIAAVTGNLPVTDADTPSTVAIQQGNPSIAWSGGALGSTQQAELLAALGTGKLSINPNPASPNGGTQNVGYSWDPSAADLDFLGQRETLTISYQLTLDDGTDTSAPQTLSFTISGVNDAPVAKDDSFSGNEDNPISGNVLADNGNGVDSDSEGDAFNVSLQTDVSNGTLTLGDDGAFTYQPDPDFSGTDSFTYTLSDGSATTTGTVTLTVGDVNDLPETVATTASDSEDPVAPIAVSLSGTDVDGTVAGFKISDYPADGRLFIDAAMTNEITGIRTIGASGNAATIYFMPNADFNGTASFTYVAVDDDSGVDSSPATATITVSPVNDIAVISGEDTGNTAEDGTQTASGTLSVTDADAGEAKLVAQTDTAGTYGNFSVDADGAWTYTLANNSAAVQGLAAEENRTDSFTVASADGSATKTVTITVTGENDTPIARDDAFSIPEHFGGGTFNVLNNNGSGADFDPDGDTLEIVGVGQTFQTAQGGTMEIVDRNPGDAGYGNFKYTPPADFDGTDSFTYTITDGIETSTATITITIQPEPDAPTGTDKTVSVNEDEGLAFADTDFGFADVDTGDSMKAVRIDSPLDAGKGTLELDGEAVSANQVIGVADLGKLVFTPAADANGSGYASFDFSVQDSSGLFSGSSNTMTIDVTAVDDAPRVSPITLDPVTDEDAAVIIDLLAGQIDVDGDGLSATGVTVTDNLDNSVTFIDNHDGTITIDPTQFADALAFGQSRTLTINYSVTDSITPVANTATLVVDGANQDPVLSDLGPSVGFNENTVNAYPVYIDTQVSLADDSADFDGGALTVSGLASSGEDTVGIANQGTSAGRIGVSGNEVSYGGTLIGTFTGGTGTDPLVVSFNASATPEAVDALIQSLYFSNSSDEPTEDRTLTYTVTDGDGGTVSATVDVHVYPQIEPPIAVNDTIITNAEYAETISVAWEAVLANDIPNGGISLVLPGEFAEDGGGETLDHTVNSYGYFGYFDSNAGGGSNQAYVGVQTVSGATISGTSGNDIIILEENSPATISGGGGADWLYGSYGNDTFLISDTGFAKVDGGGFETDVLKLTGAGQALDLVAKGDYAVKEIDVFDLTGTGDNTLVANYQRFASSTSTSYYDKNDKTDYKLFHITGDAGDQVQLEDSSAWTWIDDVTENGIVYKVYTQSDPNGIDHDVKLFIQSEVSDNLNAPPVAAADTLSGTVTPAALTDDIAVNSVPVGTGEQDYAGIASLTGGGFVVTWAEQSQAVGNWDIFAQRYDSDGNPVGAKIALPTEFSGDRVESKVTALDTGGFVVAWAGYGEDAEYYGVFTQMYDASGVAVGGRIAANTYTTDSQDEPSIAGLPGGGFIVTWTSKGQDGSSDGVYARRFDASGDPIDSSEFLVNSTTQAAQNNPVIAGFDDGGFVIVWAGYGVSSYAVYGRQFDASGAAMGAIEFKINSGTSNSVGHPAVTALDGGGYVVTWVSNGQDGNNYAIYGQRYDASGQTVGSEFQAGVVARNLGSNTDVAALAGGGFIVTWFDTDADNVGLYGQRFDADGTAIGDVFAVNEITTSGQWNFEQTGTTAVLADGTFAAVWHTYGTSGEGDIVVRLFNAFVITEDNVFTFDADELLANDTDADGDTLSITAITDEDGNAGNGITSTEGATLTLNGDGTISYDPTGVAAFDELDAGETKTDTFTYTVSDGNGGTNTATVSIEVSGVNDAPVANNDVLDIRNEFPVNSYTEGSQLLSQSAHLANGNTIVVWTSGDEQQDDDGYGIKARIFDASGDEIVSEFLVNAETAGNQFSPTVTPLANGNFVVSWETVDASGHPGWRDVHARLFTADGQPVGTEFLVNVATYSNQADPNVTALSDGGFVIAWSENAGILARIFDADGGEKVSDFQVNTYDAGSQNYPKVTELSNGDIAFVWQTNSAFAQGDSSLGAITAQVFKVQADGVGGYEAVATVAEFLINAETNSQQLQPSVAALDGGRFVVTWQSSDREDDPDIGIKARVFNADGSGLVSEFLVNVETDSTQIEPTVAALSNGDFVITWISHDGTGDASAPGVDNSSSGIKARVFRLDDSDNLVAVSGEFLVNEFIDGRQEEPAVTALANGGFMVSWTSHESPQDSSERAVQARFFDANGNPVEINYASENGVTLITADELLANDTDVEGHTLSITEVDATSTNGAALTLNADGTISYDPSGSATIQAYGDGQTLPDSFTYTVSDGNGGTATATVTITVAGLNGAPVIKSSASVGADENQTAALTVMATDEENQDLTFSITGGDDASFFTIDADTGELSFVSEPNYENPQDASADNVYDVEVTVTDTEGASDAQAIAVSVNDVSGTNLFGFAARPANSILYGYAELADVDGDKDLDAVVGQADGFIRYFENTGTSDASNFVERLGTDNPFDGLRSKYYSSPSLVDIDHDGDLDLFVGRGDTSGDYSFKVWENTGSATAPVFTRLTGTDNPLDGFTFGNSINAAFGDITGDNVLDMVVGASTGKLRFLENTGTIYDPVFVERTGIDNPFNGISVVNPNDVGALGYSAPELVDWNDDGLLDLVIGTRSLGFQLYLNTGTATAPAFTLQTSPFGGINYSYVTGALGDLNGDDLLDILVGSSTYVTQYNSEPLRLASTPVDGEAVGATLSETDLQPVIDKAIGLFAAAGASAEQLEALHETSFAIGDLPGDVLGLSIGTAVTLDENAAGAGWHVDTDGTDIAGADLLTVVLHEMGHQLGLGDTDAEGLMNHELATDERVLPGALRTGTDGDDVLHVDSADLLHIDGGEGLDALSLDGAGITLDFALIADDAVESVERIDLTGSGDNSLSIALADVLDMSGEVSNGVTTLTVNGDAGDVVSVADFGDWAQQADAVVEGADYHVFTNEFGRLLVEDNVTVTAA